MRAWWCVALAAGLSLGSVVHAAPVAVSPASADLTLTLAVPKRHFFQGEEIDATLTFTNHSPHPYYTWMGGYDRSGRIPDITFHAQDTRGGEVADPIGWYLSQMVGLGGGIGNYTRLGSWSITLPVNQWLRFDRPGTYTLVASASRVHPGRYDNPPDLQNPEVPLVSNRLAITIDPLTPARETALLDHARAVLAKPDPSYMAHVFPKPEVIAELERLSYMRTPAAIRILLPYLSEGNNDAGRRVAFALAGSIDPKAEAAVLLDGVKRGQPLLNQYGVMLYQALKLYDGTSRTMGLGWVMYGPDHKPLPPPKDQAEAYREIIAAGKSGPPVAVASACWADFQNHPKDPAARAALVAHRAGLTVDERNALVEQWQGELNPGQDSFGQQSPPMSADDPFHYGGSDLLPILRQAVVEDTNPNALEVYCQMAPDEARSIVIADIERPQSVFLTKPNTVYGWPLGLNALPDKPIPELTATFRAKLADPETDSQMLLPLIDRYGTAELLPDLIRFYQPKIGTCACFTENACLRFWIKCDPAGGLAAL
jgi:hypothetical protein